MFDKFLINIIISEDSKIIITLHEITKKIFIKKIIEFFIFIYFYLTLERCNVDVVNA